MDEPNASGGTTADAVRLPAEAASARVARHFVEGHAAGRVEDLDLVVVMTSELVSNVIRHARTEVTVRVAAGDRFRVEVADGVAATETFRALFTADLAWDPLELDGRGLALVRTFASSVGLDDEPDGGKCVWFEVPAAADGS